jgi:hypothetical protein
MPPATAPETDLDGTTAQLTAQLTTLALVAKQPVAQPGVQLTVLSEASIVPKHLMETSSMSPLNIPSSTTVLTCPETWNEYLALPPHQRAIWARALHKEFDAMKTMNMLFPVPIHIARTRTR